MTMHKSKGLEFPVVFIANTTRVFIFIIVIALLFLLYESFIGSLLGFIERHSK